jgi:hypothetical protein
MKGLQALWGCSTYLNEQKSPSQHMFGNQCVMRSGWVFKKFTYWEGWKKIWNQCVKNCSCWRYWCSPRLENSPWTLTLPVAHPVNASPPPSWQQWRLVFWQWHLTKCVVNTQFVANIMYTYEAGLTGESIVNFHSTHVLVDDNPHTTIALRHHHWFFTSVWVGILGDRPSGQVVIPNRLTGAVCHRFLVNDLSVLLEYVPPHQQQHVWFMHDGAPPHFLHTIRQYLNQTFQWKWIGCKGLVNWPAWSPDLNPLDFWLWEHLKTLVYSVPVSDSQVLQQWIERMPIRRFSWNQEFSTECTPLCDEELKVMLKWVGTT